MTKRRAEHPAATSRKRSNIPPVIFSPRFFRLLWMILRERFRGR